MIPPPYSTALPPFPVKLGRSEGNFVHILFWLTTPYLTLCRISDIPICSAAVPGTFERMASSPAPRIVEVAFAKNEGRFLLEWIAYHRLIGVGDFLVYTNDCEDESPALLDRLQEMGHAAHMPNPLAPGEQAQNKALNRAAEHPLVKAADYVLQIDPDEFLCIKTGGGRIADLIATAPEADAICVQMRFFGDSGFASLPDGLVIANLTRAS